MSNIFDDDSGDNDVEIRTDNEYAKSYNIWRKKEEINKIKTKYGDDVNLDEDSSSSSDDEEGVELTEEIEKNFFVTLAYLKNKDPRIYNENVTFFKDKSDSKSSTEKKKKKDAPMYLKDYERKIILENGGIFSDEESNPEIKSKSTYVEEQEYIKENLKHALSAIDDNKESDEEWGGLFKERKKTQEEKEKEELNYKKWLAGEKEKIDEDVETELKPLKDYWNNPNLEDGEKFLRDYILNKKFLEKDDEDYIPTYDEIIHDSDQDLSNDEEMIEKQEEFEHKFNFRFEEPDQDFIKRYPRTMENSARKKDDRRKLKRQETKERKLKEKEEKMKELKKLQELKRNEIEEKLEKLREITGNTDIEFKNEDIDGDFDPEAHDRRMQALFSEDYYQGPEEEQKPIFPEIDEELDIENWDRYEAENESKTQQNPHCEDDDFIMDCEYDPHGSIQNELIERSKSKKKRKRKSKVAEALSKPKPKFDPNDKNYEKYFDEYYKLDCEDIIGDIPCRFKYRQVVPNDFGLSVEEILLAKERELNKWCSLKKAVQIRPDNVEKYDQIAYKKKAQNVNLKKRILPSLFTPDSEGNSLGVRDSGKINITNGNTDIEKFNEETIKDINNVHAEESNISDRTTISSKKKKKIRNNFNNEPHNKTIKEMSKSEKIEGGDQSKKIQRKRKVSTNTNEVEVLKKSKTQRKRKISTNTNEVKVLKKPKKQNKQKQLKQNKKNKELLPTSISDARLSAYGINPKKYKNKLKYGNTQTVI